MHPPPPGRSALATSWALEPGVVFLNHGSFGACPTPVLEAQLAWRARLEAQPVRFLARELEGALDDARAELATFVGADPDDLAFVPNATHGLNTVLRSLRFEAGDELLTTDHEYNAAVNALRATAERDGARVTVATIPFPARPGDAPLRGPDAVREAVLAAVTSRTRLALLSHVTSPTALILPLERLAADLAARGLDVLVDGAHAPGMLPLDLGRLGEAGVTYYTGNGHKWLCGPKGSGFLWVRRDRQAAIRPLAISHGANSPRRDRSRFRLEFDWTGTADPSAYLALPAALRFLGALRAGGWREHMAANHALAAEGRATLLDALEQAAPAPVAMLGSMAVLPLPAPRSPRPEALTASPLDDDPLQAELRERYGIEVPILTWPQPWRAELSAPPAPSGRLLRLSAQAYNHPTEYRYAASALLDVLGR
ncbi:MAG: aminotransferase class V-fold PLP-dependent enzyme [Candidatus Limnocylindrales bacterium]